MEIEAVTTFSKKGWESYGKRFLDSYCEFWPIKIHVYWEGPDWPKEYPTDKVIWHDLDEDRDREAFLRGGRGDDVKDYRFCAKRFSHKVFALTDPMRETPSGGYLLWLDADVETTAPITQEFFEKVLTPGFAGSYLGRKDWNHSECGFVAYHESSWGLLKEIRQIYTSGDIFDYEEWHDSYIFDQIREKYGHWNNLSQDLPGMHVWDDCILGEYMLHFKGPERKAGKKIEQMGYGSDKEMKNSVGNVGGTNMLVKTKNCVPDANIQANVHYSSTLTENYLPQCALDAEAVCIMVSAGPSLQGSLEDIRALAEKPNHYVVAVKHAINDLLAAGIDVYACVLLDPRSHVADFVPEENYDIKYFVASMCHPSTFDKLSDKDYWVYHAHVGAGEDKVLSERLGDTFMISGGCSTALRGLYLMHSLGFRRFRLFAYDCCYPDIPDNITELDKFGNTKYFEIEIEGRKFWTDAEKVAQVQDFSGVMEHMGDMDFEVYGPGAVPHLWNAKRKIMPNFKDIVGG